MHRMMERQEDDGSADMQRARAGGHGRGHDERRRKETVLVLMVLTEETGMEPARLGELGFGDDFVDAAVEVLPAWRIGNRAVEAEFHAAILRRRERGRQRATYGTKVQLAGRMARIRTGSGARRFRP